MTITPMGSMKEVASASKLTQPNSKGAMPRERLFEWIERGRQKKVLWISGPAGSGKTTLAASYFGSRKDRCLWYQVDEGDNDPATMFYYLGVAARKIGRKKQAPLPLLTPEYLLGMPVFAKRFFEQLCKLIIGGGGGRSSVDALSPAIVFDNYQLVPEDAALQDAISAGLFAVPDGITFVFLSRNEPPPAFSRLRVENEMSLLSWEDIRLTAEESNAIANRRAGTDLPEKTLSRLYQETDGWAAGLVLFVESLRIKNFDYPLSVDLSKEEIFSYIASELFDRRSSEDQRFLLETAFLPRMTVRMAEALTGNPRSGRFISDLNRKNYFTHKYASGEQAFQFHPLFRDFLISRAREVMPPELLQGLRSRAATVLGENGYIEEAVNLYTEARQWPQAASLILTNAPVLASQGRWQSLLAWIKALPEPLTSRQPWCLYWMGLSILPLYPVKSFAFFEKAFELFKVGKDMAGAFLSLSGMIDSVALKADGYIEMDRLILFAEALIKENGHQFPNPDIESRMTASMLYAIVFRQADHPDLAYWESRGMTLSRDAADRDTVFRILAVLALHKISIGEIEKAKLLLDSFQRQIEGGRRQFKTGGYAPISPVILRFIQALCYWLDADFEKARSVISEGLTLLGTMGIHLNKSGFYQHAAATALSLGEIDQAGELLRQAESSMAVSPQIHSEAYYHLLMAWLGLLQGHLTLAATHADQALTLHAAVGNPLHQPSYHLIKAVIMHRLKNNEEASLHFQEAHRFIRRFRLYQLEYMTLLFEASIAFDEGNTVSGRHLLSRALAMGREHGYANGFFWMDTMIAKLCGKALEADIETEYVRHLIRKRRLTPDETGAHLENWPWALKILTLGTFELIRDDKPLRFSGKLQQKPLQLLKALIALGGQDVKEEHLCDILWPDADGDFAHHAFETTLYRLRKLLGIENALRLNDRKLSLDLKYGWVDAFSFERLLNEVGAFFEKKDLSSPNAISEAVRISEKVMKMYKGPFLRNESDERWTLPYRERLKVKLVHLIEWVGTFWIGSGEPEKAVRAFEKGLEVDELAEELYRHLMASYHQLGLQAKVHATYGRCCSILKTRLGILPSAKTKAIFLNQGRQATVR